MEEKTQTTLPFIRGFSDLELSIRGPWLEIRGAGSNPSVLPRVEKASMVKIRTKEDPRDQNSKEITVEIPTFRIREDGTIQVPQGLANQVCIALNRPIPERKKDGTLYRHGLQVMAAIERLETRQGPLKITPTQMEILQETGLWESKGYGSNINAAMGSGKTMLCLFLAMASPELRPCVVSGRGETDTKQIHKAFLSFLEKNPEFKTPENHVILWGAGGLPRKADKKAMAEKRGILVVTHKGLHNIPEGTKLLILDESHTAATVATITNILDRGADLQRIDALSATGNMRPDGGDKFISILSNTTRVVKTHTQFEEEGRVSPVQLHIHHFHPEGKYCHTPGILGSAPSYGHSTQNQFAERHRGRHRFVADLLLDLPASAVKVIYTPRAEHAAEIAEAIKLEILNRVGLGAIDNMAAFLNQPVVMHAEGLGRKERLNPSPPPGNILSGQDPDPDAEQQLQKEKDAAKEKRRVNKENLLEMKKRLLEGKLKCVVVTDFMAVGLDTDVIDHVIDASGQMAKAMSIQRSGRGVRPRENKISHYHIVLDNHTPNLFYPQREKVLEVLRYYGLDGIDTPLTPLIGSGVALYRKGTRTTWSKISIRGACPDPESFGAYLPENLVKSTSTKLFESLRVKNPLE
jgi:hypothetical protein